eukprot:463527-Prymnesium_polylepis.1
MHGAAYRALGPTPVASHSTSSTFFFDYTPVTRGHTHCTHLYPPAGQWIRAGLSRWGIVPSCVPVV